MGGDKGRVMPQGGGGMHTSDTISLMGESEGKIDGPPTPRISGRLSMLARSAPSMRDVGAGALKAVSVAPVRMSELSKDFTAVLVREGEGGGGVGGGLVIKLMTGIVTKDNSTVSTVCVYCTNVLLCTTVATVATLTLLL